MEKISKILFIVGMLSLFILFLLIKLISPSSSEIFILGYAALLSLSIISFLLLCIIKGVLFLKRKMLEIKEEKNKILIPDTPEMIAEKQYLTLLKLNAFGVILWFLFSMPIFMSQDGNQSDSVAVFVMFYWLGLYVSIIFSLIGMIIKRIGTIKTANIILIIPFFYGIFTLFIFFLSMHY